MNLNPDDFKVCPYCDAILKHQYSSQDDNGREIVRLVYECKTEIKFESRKKGAVDSRWFVKCTKPTQIC